MQARRTGRIAPGSFPQQQRVIHLGVVLALTLLSACAYHKKLDKPVPLQPAGAIAIAADERLSVTLDAIIVRDGPGSWSKNADWDEYLLHARTSSAQPVEITRIVVVDSLDKRRKPSAIRGDLQSGSKETARRYKDANLEVTAGYGGAGLVVAGYAVGGASAAVGLATLGTSGAAAGAAVAGAVLVAPVLMTAGIVVGVQEIRVQNEIRRRSTVFPAQVAADQERPLDLFFPIAPAPQRMEVTYRNASGEHVLVIDTKAALAGLHLLPVAESPPREREPPP
jgi:hypothetical protein